MATAIDTLAPLRSRAAALAAIAGGHIMLVYFLMNGLAQQVIAFVSPPTVVSFISDDHPRPRPPEIVATDPTRGLRRIDEDPPVIKIKDPIEPPPVSTPPGGDTISDVVQTGGNATPPALVLVGRNELPNTEDYYPAAERRRAREGISEVRVCVDERGRLQGEPSIQRSSGSELLDAGALAVVRAGHYARATRGGVPVGNCYGFRIAFRMK